MGASFLIKIIINSKKNSQEFFYKKDTKLSREREFARMNKQNKKAAHVDASLFEKLRSRENLPRERNFFVIMKTNLSNML